MNEIRSLLCGVKEMQIKILKKHTFGDFFTFSVITCMSIEIFQLLIGAIFTGSIAGLIFVVYKIITEEQEKKLERSKVKLHWKEHRKICEQNLRSRGD